NDTNNSPVAPGLRFLGLDLQQGIGRVHLSHFLIASFAAIMLSSFLPQMQAFLFSEFLQLPQERHGRVSGMLNFWQEIVIIAVVAVVGPLSDRWGRKPLMAGGFLLMALGIALHPQASSVAELLAYRCVFAVGVAAVIVIMVTLLADYVADRSRGKAAGYQGVMNGLGAVVAVFLLLRLPALFQKNGSTAIEAGTDTYYLVAGIAAVAGLMMLFGLKSGRPQAAVEARLPFMQGLRAGYSAARDPRIALAYGASFIARGNLAIVGTFLALWGANHGTTELGLERAAALAKAGMLVGMAQGVALLGAPIFGILADKLDRVKALAIALLVSGLGYSSTFFVHDPFGGLMMVSAMLIGLGEVGCIITSGVLISQQSPEHNRGAIIGTFNLSGAVGILVASVAGGWLFDHWREPGPFVVFGLLALAMMVWALLLTRRER
ncbi:MAG TPA: MFS transporter, partial [Fontimonas sp.]